MEQGLVGRLLQPILLLLDMGFVYMNCQSLPPESLGAVLETHEIELGGKQLNFKWFRRAGVAKVDVVTTEISPALTGAGLVMVAVPSKGHKPFFEKIIPYLEDGQVISIFPDNFGSLMLRNMMRERGCEVNVIIGGWSSMLWGQENRARLP